MRGGIMATYRFFFLGSDGHITGADVADCPTDAEAVALARSTGGAHRAIEIWELKRRVERVEATQGVDEPAA